ncbi:MAG: GUN4 domain-containing protein [Trichocoleus desertorum ATA4-8-CV12]|jgi:hypothetical protein|nr:GUN4 domain-containing protein [Trichocoleus desertorum ATA4-8-CV12]
MADSPKSTEASSPSPEPTSESNKPSPERRFIQRQVVQPLIQWMPLGGSGWLFASFWLKQEWTQVLLTFPVTIVTAVWAAYSKNFVERLSEIYAEKGKQDAEVLNQLLANLDETIKWQFSGFEAKYLELQAKPCQEYITEGFNPDKTAIPMLEEVFVPLQLNGYLIEGNGRFIENRKDSAKANQSSEGINIWDLILRSRKNPTFRQMAIQAQGGFGKTTLLRHIALIYGQGKYRRYRAPKLIPFLLYLRDWRDKLSQPELPTLPDLIKNHFLPKLSPNNPLKPPPAWVENLLEQGGALVMFDGFDELAEDQRQRVSQWISQQMQEYHRTTFIITSRPAGFKDYVAKRPAVPLFVQKFKSYQQERFIKRWYLCQERCARSEKQANQAKEAAERNAQKLLTQLQDPDRPELQEMAENPLLLNMLATFHRFDPGTELPKRRIELYRGICKLQLEDRPRARGIPMLLPYEKSHQVLQSLALAMVKRSSPRVSCQSLISFLKKHPLLKQEDVGAEALLKQMVQISELLVERELGYYEFPHLSFQGYFAASFLAQNHIKSLALVRENWDKASWRETILLYSAQLPPRLMTDVIQQVCDLGKEAAQLAYDCLREYRNPEKLDPGLEQELRALTSTVQTLRYTKLEEYLKSRHWKEADQETYRLMITTVGRTEGEWFEPEELLTFPRDELRAIDALWVKYSHGMFGFSVQKQIYVGCGAKLDGKFPGDEIWWEFGNLMGWRRNGKWLSYSQVVGTSFSLPNTILPVIGTLYYGVDALVSAGACSLLSHKDL